MRHILLNFILVLLLTSCNNDVKKQLDLINQKVDNEEFNEALALIDRLDIKDDTLNYKRVLIKKQYCENQLGFNQKAIETLEEILRIGNNGDKQYLNQIAVMNFKNGNLEMAFSTMDRLRKTGLKFGLLEYYHLGLFEYSRSNYQNAITYFDSAWVCSKDPEIIYYKSICEIELGQYEKAIKNIDYFEHERSDSSYINIYLRRAFANFKLKKMTEVEKDFKIYMSKMTDWEKDRITFWELAGTKNNAQ